MTSSGIPIKDHRFLPVICTVPTNIIVQNISTTNRCPALDGKDLFTDNEIYRVATAQGKQGIWFILFPDRENTGNFAVTQGKYFILAQGEI